METNKPHAEITLIKRPVFDTDKKTSIGIEYVAFFSYFNNDMGMMEELPFKFKIDLTSESKLDVNYDIFGIDSLYKTMEFQLPKILDKETFTSIKEFGIQNIPITKSIGFASRM